MRQAELRRLFDAGVFARDIARELGVTTNAVIGRWHRLGWARRGLPVETTLNRLQKLHDRMDELS